VSEWNHNYVVTALAPLPGGSALALGDAIQSVSVLAAPDGRLATAAVDHAPLWPVALGALDARTVVGVNVSCAHVVVNGKGGR
jgi:hypothetical protein